MCDFVQKSGKLTEDQAKLFREHDVDGASLFALSNSDYDTLIPDKIGARRRVQMQIHDLHVKLEQTEAETSDVHMQDLSVTVYAGADTQLCFAGPLLTGTELPRAALVCYTGSSQRRNRWGNDDDEEEEDERKKVIGEATVFADKLAHP